MDQLIIKNLVTALIKSAPALLAAAFQLVQTINKGLIQGLSSIFNTGLDIVKSIGNGIANGVSIVVGKAKNLGSAVLRAIKNSLIGITSIGRNLVEGLWRGVSDKIGWVTSKMASFGKKVINSLKNFFGIHSPSTVMRDEIGKFLAEGVAVGFMENDPMIAIKTSLNKGIRKITAPSLEMAGSGGYGRNDVSIIQNIYSQAQTAADLMQEAIYQQEKAVYLGV